MEQVYLSIIVALSIGFIVLIVLTLGFSKAHYDMERTYEELFNLQEQTLRDMKKYIFELENNDFRSKEDINND